MVVVVVMAEEVVVVVMVMVVVVAVVVVMVMAAQGRCWARGGSSQVETVLPSMVVCGAIEFKMDKKSYRMIPLANSEDYLYNMPALSKDKAVCMYIEGLLTPS